MARSRRHAQWLGAYLTTNQGIAVLSVLSLAVVASMAATESGDVLGRLLIASAHCTGKTGHDLETCMMSGSGGNYSSWTHTDTQTQSAYSQASAGTTASTTAGTTTSAGSTTTTTGGGAGGGATTTTTSTTQTQYGTYQGTSAGGAPSTQSPCGQCMNDNCQGKSYMECTTCHTSWTCGAPTASAGSAGSMPTGGSAASAGSAGPSGATEVRCERNGTPTPLPSGATCSGSVGATCTFDNNNVRCTVVAAGPTTGTTSGGVGAGSTTGTTPGGMDPYNTCLWQNCQNNYSKLIGGMQCTAYCSKTTGTAVTGTPSYGSAGSFGWSGSYGSMPGGHPAPGPYPHSGSCPEGKVACYPPCQPGMPCAQGFSCVAPGTCPSDGSTGGHPATGGETEMCCPSCAPQDAERGMCPMGACVEVPRGTCRGGPGGTEGGYPRPGPYPYPGPGPMPGPGGDHMGDYGALAQLKQIKDMLPNLQREVAGNADEVALVKQLKSQVEAAEQVVNDRSATAAQSQAAMQGVNDAMNQIVALRSPRHEGDYGRGRYEEEEGDYRYDDRGDQSPIAYCERMAEQAEQFGDFYGNVNDMIASCQTHALDYLSGGQVDEGQFEDIYADFDMANACAMASQFVAGARQGVAQAEYVIAQVAGEDEDLADEMEDMRQDWEQQLAVADVFIGNGQCDDAFDIVHTLQEDSEEQFARFAESMGGMMDPFSIVDTSGSVARIVERIAGLEGFEFDVDLSDITEALEDADAEMLAFIERLDHDVAALGAELLATGEGETLFDGVLGAGLSPLQAEALIGAKEEVHNAIDALNTEVEDGTVTLEPAEVTIVEEINDMVIPPEAVPDVLTFIGELGDQPAAESTREYEEVQEVITDALVEGEYTHFTDENYFDGNEEQQWHEFATAELADAGVITGNPDGTYQSEKGVNTAEFSKMIATALIDEEELPENIDVGAADLPRNTPDWAEPYVEEVAIVVAAHTDQDLRDLLPRAEEIVDRGTAAIIVNASLDAVLPEYDPSNTPSDLVDLPEDDRVRISATRVADANIMGQTADGTFSPEQDLDKGQVAAITLRATKYKQHAEALEFVAAAEEGTIRAAPTEEGAAGGGGDGGDFTDEGNAPAEEDTPEEHQASAEDLKQEVITRVQHVNAPQMRDTISQFGFWLSKQPYAEASDGRRVKKTLDACYTSYYGTTEFGVEYIYKDMLNCFVSKEDSELFIDALVWVAQQPQ